VRVETVDADHHGLVAPVDFVEALDDVLARLLLVVGRDGILEVEEDDVGRALGRLLEERRVRPRDGQF
jgi:hypothetical protein